MDNITISLSDCPFEATLAEDVLNDNGVIVLKAGTCLTQEKIHSLEKYGFDNVVIKSMHRLSAAELEEKRIKIEKNIDKRMRKCEMNDDMKNFKNILVAYLCDGGN